jgi:hypothetical protein
LAGRHLLLHVERKLVDTRARGTHDTPLGARARHERGADDVLRRQGPARLLVACEDELVGDRERVSHCNLLSAILVLDVALAWTDGVALQYLWIAPIRQDIGKLRGV